MRTSVQANARAFNERFEGSLSFMYLDQEGYVTTGEGNLIDPMTIAMGLPWQVDGRDATPAEISNAWSAVKARTDLEKNGGGAYASVTNLRLTSEAITNLVLAKLGQDEDTLRKYFPQWDNFPADAQLGILSMAWAMGPAFPQTFTSFTEAANSGDWATAAAQSQMKPTPGIAPRNTANLLLFTNAATPGIDPAELYWPNVAAAAVVAAHPVVTWGAIAVLLAIGAWGTWRLHEGGIL